MLTPAQRDFLGSYLARARVRPGGSVRSAPSASADSQRSGSAPDERDPALLGGAIGRLIMAKGWDLQVATGRLHARWPHIVGPEVAQHVVIETFDMDPSGQAAVLVLRADSTAWATQMTYMLDEVGRAVDADLGAGRVREIVVNGPAAPSWKHGPRSVKGRGPRDTYG